MSFNSTRFPLAWLLPAVVLLMPACSETDDGAGNPADPQPTQPPVALVSNDLSGTSSAMGYSLFRQLVADKPGENIIISPWSLQSSLLMATEGATGATRSELEALLRLETTELETVRNEYLAVHAALTSAGGHPTVTSANAFFYDSNRLQVNPTFTDLVDEHYSAGAQDLPFVEPSSRQAINDWVSDQTNELVPNILEEPIPGDQIFYLINALYFKSNWMKGFNSDFTSDDGFRRGDGSVVEVPMITGTDLFLYTETESLEMIDLAFKDSTFSLSMIVPKDDEVMDQTWLDGVAPEGMSELYAGLEQEYLQLRFPQMELGFKYDLIPDIRNLGYHVPFSASANFSGISEQQGADIFLDPVLHEVKLKVDEKGAEGAAVTVVGGAVLSSPPVIAFDRPFVLSLRHIPTGVQLFFGLVDKPMP